MHDLGPRSDPAPLLLAFVQARDEVNDVSVSLLGEGRPVIADASLRVPRLEPPELGFLRVVAWLYVQYYEVGKVGIRFLVDLFEPFGLDEDRLIREHLLLTRNLRTYLQHNLDPGNESDTDTRDTCEAWFDSVCGSRVPGDESHWGDALLVLLRDARVLCRTLLQATRYIERDEGRDGLVERWIFRLERSHPPAAFDDVISVAANDMGRAHLDVPKFRKRHVDKWVRQLNELEPDYDFTVEARKLVEGDLLTDDAAVMPLTGADIILDFGIEPGPRVGELLAQARSLYDSHPCGQDELLARLREASQ